VSAAVKELCLYIARGLVDDPGSVEVRELPDGRLELSTAARDAGKLIGRRGRTAKAIRSLVRLAGGERGGPEVVIAGSREGSEDGQEPAAE
jgi:predicted RNA-binding protein YlqC (UPF0109 family)